MKSDNTNKLHQSKKLSSVSWQMYSLVGIVAVACYLNSVSGDFVHDDIPAVVNNKDVLAINSISDGFRNDFWGTPMAHKNSHKSYRPLTILSFRVNYLLFGLKSIWFHLTNVLLHMLASVLFTMVCLDVARLEIGFATVAGLLFAVHPVHTEAVTGIVGRADVLSSVLFSLSLLTFHSFHKPWINICLGGLSMLAKETGITVFLVNFFFDFYKTWPIIKRTFLDLQCRKDTLKFLKRSFINLTSCATILLMRLAMLQGSLPTFSEQDNPAAFHPSWFVRSMTYSYLAAFNWWLLLCPSTLSHDWQMGSIPLITSILDSRNIFTCFFFIIIITLVLRCINDFENQENPSVILGVLLILLPFLPATNLFVTVGFVIAERILYIPSMGYILLVTTGIKILWYSCIRHRQTMLSCVFLLLMTFAWRSVMRNRDWLSRESLLRSGIATLPHNAKMHYNYGNFLRENGHIDLAIVHYHTALRLWPSYASAHNNLATILKHPIDAEKHFLLAIHYSQQHLNAHYNLGRMYRKGNRTAEAEKMLLRCLSIDVRFKSAFLELAALSGYKINIGIFLRNISKLNLFDYEFGFVYANWLLKNGNFQLSLNYLLKIARTSENLDIILVAMKILRKFGNQARILQLLNRKISTRKNFVESNFYLQNWYRNLEVTKKSVVYTMK